MNRIAGRSMITVLFAIILVAGLVFFLCEYGAKAGDWVVFDGSPHVYNGGNIGCGVMVDRDNNLLLDTSGSRTYSDSAPLRKATVHWLGDRNGSVSAPALSHYSSQIVGYDLLNGVYHYGDATGVATLTLSASAQMTALEALGDHKGTVGVYNYKTGEILCAVSTPSFDPDNVPDLEKDTSGKYDSIFVNRFTQGRYTPGSIFKIVTLAAALEEIPDIAGRTFTCTGSVSFGSDKITCEGAHWDQSLKTAFRNSCNVAFSQIAQEIGAQKLQEYAEKFGLTQSMTFDGITTAEGNFDVTDVAPVSLGWASIGQYTDLVNPCAFMNFMGAIAGGGQGVQPHLVQKIAVGKSQTYQADSQQQERIMSEETAAVLQEYLRNNVENKYGSDNFPGLTVCAKTGTGEVGGDRKPNAMFAGFVSDEEYPLAFIVCVEDGGYGAKTCIPIASKVLQACKESMS